METVINNQMPLEFDEGKRKRGGTELIQKAKVKKETEISTRKKPGRKKIEVTESNTKKEKNRVAQRAWRERKEKYVLELEAKINDLENANSKSEKEKQQLKLIIEKLRNENTYLKNATSFIFTPTKETEMFMHQNKLKILHQKKNNKPNTVNNTVPVETQPTPVNPELVNNNVVYDNNNINTLLSDIDENLLAETDPEVLNELYKLLNMQNQDTTLSNPSLMTPDSLISSTSSPLVQSMSSSDPSNNMYSMMDYNTVPNAQADPNNVLLMNGHNNNQALLNQQHLNTINPALINPSTTEVLPNTISSTLPNATMDQNSLLTMSMLNNIPVTYGNIQQHPVITPAALSPNIGMQGMNNNLYPMNNLHPATAGFKPMVNGAQAMHPQQLDDDEIFQQINHAQEIYTNPITGMPSPSITIKNVKDQPSTPDALATIGAPYTPEDLDSDSNKSGEVGYTLPKGLPNFEENLDNPIEIRTREIPMEVLERELPPERDIDDDEDDDEDDDNDDDSSIEGIQDHRNKTNHSTLQFPAQQKPTKLNIPYSVFPRVTHETVDNFINDAKLSEEELECLCSELKNKATCKEKLRYISKNVEIEGWTIEKWEKGKIDDDETTGCCQSKVKESCCSESLKKESCSEALKRETCSEALKKESCSEALKRESCSEALRNESSCKVEN